MSTSAKPAMLAAIEPSPHPDNQINSIFTGHSGAQVTLRQSNGQSIVRKTAGKPETNGRLRNQAEKQLSFWRAGFAVPEIIRSGFDEGLFFFDMRYVPSTSIASLCAAGSAASVPSLSSFVARWIDQMRGATSGTIGQERLRAKLQSVIAACRDNPVLRHSMAVIELLGSLLSQTDWPLLPEGPCHGDLTLENILIDRDGHLWLIDFDAPDLSSYWLDLAKLYQDLDGQWCLRRLAMDRQSVSYLNAVIAVRQMRTAIDQVVETAIPGLLLALPPLVALNLMRALPYCQDIATAVFILNRVHAVLAPNEPPSATSKPIHVSQSPPSLDER